jgi:hypothetical protein
MVQDKQNIDVTEYPFYIDDTRYIPKNEEERLEMERIVNEILENYPTTDSQEGSQCQ